MFPRLQRSCILTINGGSSSLKFALFDGRNEVNAPLISVDSAATAVRVIRTDEELMIARCAVLCLKST